MYFTLLLIILVARSSSLNLLDVCQSGIRDDGTSYVHCARKSLTEVPRFATNRLFNLPFDELILSDNAITHIHTHAFHGLRIKRLIMSGNQLKSIDQNAFRELENYLEELVLEFDSTVVDRIPHAIQSNLVNIRSLTLIGLNLRTLPTHVFDKMRKLEYLNLKSCHLQVLEPNAFQAIEKQLRHLYLDQNKLTKSVFNEINRLTLLEKLSLSHNAIDELDTELSHTRLKHLDLSYNSLKTLFLTNLNNLQVLNLQNNLLTAEQLTGPIPTQLKELILDFNAIHFLDQHWIPAENSLEVLSLQSNEFLLADSSAFQHLKKLSKLNLARNNIRTIPKGLFNSTRSLACLTMDRNPLLPLSPDAFAGLEHSLHNISLQSCSLTSQSLPAFSSLKHVERLKLQSNFLTTISPTDLFASMPRLLVIDLQRNQLTQIPSTFPSSLRELELGNNRLTNPPFTKQTFEQLPHLLTLDLSSNPLQCDCQISPLHVWLRTHFQAELVSYVQWVCSKPKSLAGKQLGILSAEQLVCEENRAASGNRSSPLPTISSFRVWLKDAETALLEWSSVASPFPVHLTVIENGRPLPTLRLNATQNYFLLESLKPAANYTLCLQTNEQLVCRNLTTTSPHLVSLTSSTTMVNIEYLIIAISFSICLILLILFLLILCFIKQRIQYPHSSKATTTTMDSYYQTTGSDITQTAICNHSAEERSINGFQYHPSTPIFCYCHLPSTYYADQPSYHLYHEIPSMKPAMLI